MDNKPLIIGLAAIAVIGVAVLTMSGPKKQPETIKMVIETSPSAAPSVIPSTEATMEAGAYKEGQYKADGAYTSPAGPETVTVTATLKADGTISDIEFVGNTQHPTSKKFQGQFASGYKALVLGKKIDEVKLDKVSGSSLTPIGFTDAIEKIKAEAKG